MTQVEEYQIHLLPRSHLRGCCLRGNWRRLLHLPVRVELSLPLSPLVKRSAGDRERRVESMQLFVSPVRRPSPPTRGERIGLVWLVGFLFCKLCVRAALRHCELLHAAPPLRDENSLRPQRAISPEQLRELYTALSSAMREEEEDRRRKRVCEGVVALMTEALSGAGIRERCEARSCFTIGREDFVVVKSKVVFAHTASS